MKQARLAFLWHLHQPLYRLQDERSCFLPWVRLHAIRAYYDMVRVLEEFPELRFTVNLTPALIEQIRAYEQGATDHFWETGSLPAEELDETRRAFLLDHFFSAQQEHMIGPLPRYADLLERRNRARRLRGPAEAWKELSTDDYRDLQAFFDLCWFGFKAREDYPHLRALRRKGMAYTRDDIAAIHAAEREILRRLLPLYRQAAARGQIEISTSPYAHPILPLLIDSDSAREALPEAALPPRFRAPDDARAQILDGLALVEQELGVRPSGVWPSEGALSHESAALLSRCGAAWAASDEQVLAASDRESPADPRRPWEADGAPGLALAFRDHELSDRIGFSYARLRSEEAAKDFVEMARARARGAAGDGRLILVALDGENPWEHYTRAGAHFLRALYSALLREPGLAIDTVGSAIASCPERGKIRRLRAGSWIHADLGTWIGGPEKNRAWDVLGRVRSSLEAALRDETLPAGARRRAWWALRAAEGSDWFWWLDGQFASAYRAQLDQAFRGHLRQAFEALGRPAPDLLGWPIASPEHRGEAAALAEPAARISPRIDGFEGDYFEWHGAVTLGWTDLASLSSMQRARRPVESLRYGFSPDGTLALRLDPAPGAGARPFTGGGVDLSFRLGERTLHVRLDLDEAGDLKEARLCEGESWDEGPCADSRPSRARAAARKILEISVPAREIGFPPGETAGLIVRLRTPAGGASLREIGLRLPGRPEGTAAERAGAEDAAAKDAR